MCVNSSLYNSLYSKKIHILPNNIFDILSELTLQNKTYVQPTKTSESSSFEHALFCYAWSTIQH